MPTNNDDQWGDSTLPTFGDIDFGFDHTLANGDNFMSTVRVMIGSIEYARTVFAFPGVDASFSGYLGRRRRVIIWDVYVVAKTWAYMNAFEDALNAVLGQNSEEMTCQGRTFKNVQLTRVDPQGHPEPVYEPAWQANDKGVFKHFRLTFEDLIPS